jgi:hypothetical protein
MLVKGETKEGMWIPYYMQRRGCYYYYHHHCY